MLRIIPVHPVVALEVTPALLIHLAELCARRVGREVVPRHHRANPEVLRGDHAHVQHLG